MSRSHRPSNSVRIESLEPMILMSAGVTDLEAFHQDGQTFLTWEEDTTIFGEEFHVYRHSEQITQDNIGEAERLTDKWGPLDDQTSFHQLAGAGAPRNFVIRDLGQELSDDTGLFVYTTQNGEEGNAFYAVTLVVNGQEQLLDVSGGSLNQGVQESVAETAPILVNSVNEGKGLVFTHFMDYRDWNPSFQGYAYSYSVALPFNYDPTQSYPLKVELHAYNEGGRFVAETEYFWESIQLHVDDPGADRGTVHTWWYGFAADHDYRNDGNVPVSGTIENFTQQRVLKAIDEVIADSSINVDTSRIHAFGHSMGGSGALSFGIHYGNVFAGTYSSQPMTDYAASPGFQNEFAQLWGTQQDNLLIVNDGPYANPIAQYGAGNANATGVYDWLDHGEQLVRRRGEDISFLMFGHGKNDDVIDWATQGRPFVASVEAANVAYTAENRGGAVHNWMGFGFAPHTLFSSGLPDLGNWQFRNDVSYLAVSGGSDSGTLTPADGGTDYYNLTVDWSTPWNDFDRDIVDTTNRYEISVRSLNGNHTANLTPRNLQNFIANPGEAITWQNVSNDDGSVIQQGTVAVDADGLVNLQGFSLRPGRGSRLILTSTGTPVQPSPQPEPQPEPTPQPEPAPGPTPVNRIEGTDAGEWISGTDANDLILAGGGDDTVHAPIGDNTIDGGTGRDIFVVYEGVRADFEVTTSNNGQTTVTGPGVNGTVTNVLSSIEEIHFNDEIVILTDAEPQPEPEPEPQPDPEPAPPNDPVTDEPTQISTPPGQPRISDAVVTEPEAGQQMVRLTVQLDEPAEQNLQLRYETISDSATAGEDFIGVRGTVTVLAGKSTAYIDVPVTSDDVAEGDEQFRIAIYSNLGSNSPIDTAVVRITDSDAAAPQQNSNQSPAAVSSTLSAISRIAISDDTSISAEAPDSLSGDDGILEISQGADGTSFGLLQFDVPNVPSNDIGRAILRVVAPEGFSGAVGELSLYAVNADWGEDSASWNSPAQGREWDSVDGGYHRSLDFGNGQNGLVDRVRTDSGANGALRFDVTSLVRAWLDGTIENQGLAIGVTDGTGQTYRIASSENSDPRMQPAVILTMN